MNKNLNGYKVVFTFDEVGLARLNELYKALNKGLVSEQFQVEVTDPVGGVHNIQDEKGVRPNGEVCAQCKLIDCRECEIFKRS